MRCKPGDLAVIVHSSEGVQVGKIVTVVEPWNGFPPAWSLGHIWRVRSGGSPLRYLTRFHEEIQTMEGPWPDAWLRPIRPGDTADSTEAMKEKEAA